MSYIRLSKEDWRQKYNAARQKFMRKYHLNAPQVAQALSKEDVRGMSKEQIKEMKKLFTKRMSRTETLPSGEQISRSAVTFQKHLIEGNINPERERRLNEIKKEIYHQKGFNLGPMEKQSHLDVLKQFEPLKERDYSSLKDAQAHMRKLKKKIYDPTRDERFKDNFLKALYRSGMSDQDKHDIASKVKSMAADDLAKMAVTHNEFDISYVYSEVRAASDERAEILRGYLGIENTHFAENTISKTEQGYYEGVNTRSGSPYRDKEGHITLGYDVNRVYKAIHGKAMGK